MSNPDPADLQAQIRALEAQLAALKASTAEQKVEGNTGIGINNSGEFKARNITNVHGNIYHGDPTDDPQHALRIYREVTFNLNSDLPYLAVGQDQNDPTETDQPLSLANVYVALHTKTSQTIQAEEQGKQKEKQIPITALGACGRHDRVILTGEPGGGKSTFVNHLAHALCAYQLEPSDKWQTELTPPHNGLTSKQLTRLPFRIILRDLAATLPETPNHQDYPYLSTWQKFVADQLQEQNLGFMVKPLEAELQAGQVWLLWDGLDEVTSKGQLAYIQALLNAVAKRYHLVPHLITCRVLAYEDPLYRLPSRDFPHVYQLADFNHDQQKKFVTAWHNELLKTGRYNPDQVHLFAKRLRLGLGLGGEKGRKDLYSLAGNPLLLTIMAMVNTVWGLPESRAALYEKAVEYLLWRWEGVKLQDHEATTLHQLLHEAQATPQELQDLLAEAAFLAHAQLVPEQDDGQQRAGIERQTLYDLLDSISPDHGWSQRLLEVMKRRTGLLEERKLNLFSFPHRTFQEYLAGVSLVKSFDDEGHNDFIERALALADKNQWRVVILLAVGYQAHVQRMSPALFPLLSGLCSTEPEMSDVGWRKVWLAGEAVLEMKVRQLTKNGLGRELLTRIQQGLVALIAGGYLTVRERAEVGQVLGELGDPRPGVGVNKRGVPDIVWGKPVRVGMYRIGGDRLVRRSFDKQEVTIKEAYQLAKYPITNAQFAAFVNAPDLHDSRWWEGLPEDEKQFSEPEWSTANHPRTDVSWYQAVAFCRWLSDKLAVEVRLPHEYEWEVAARYGHDKTYPWGEDEFDQTKANTREGRILQTTAVGLYPTGRQTKLELDDMSGNVLEWCQNKYHKPEDTAVDDRGESRGLRGGSWLHHHINAGAAFRNLNYNLPNFRDYSVGFRVMVVRPPSHLAR